MTSRSFIRINHQLEIWGGDNDKDEEDDANVNMDSGHEMKLAASSLTVETLKLFLLYISCIYSLTVKCRYSAMLILKLVILPLISH